MGNVNTGTTSSQSSSPAVNKAVNTLAGAVSSAYSPGKSLYQDPSANTTQGWQASLNAANNPAYSGGISGAIQSYGNRAAGNELGVNDPLYAAQRARLTDNVLTDVNSIFTGSGRFGSGSHRSGAAEGLGNALGSLDTAQRTESYGRQAEAANILPTLFQGAQLPAGIQQSIGAAQDSNNAAKANGQTDYLAKLTSILSGNAASAGTTTNTQTPLWKLLLGGAATVAGAQ